MRIASFVTSLILMGSVAIAQDASVDSDRDDEARLSFELASRHYARGEFPEAAEAFERSYAYAARPELLYNAYLAYRGANDDPNAARTLRSYLEEVEETTESRAVLEQRLAALEAEPASTTEPALTAEPAEPDDSDSSPSHDPPIGAIVLTAVGGAALITGVITAFVTGGIHSDIANECPDQTCSDLSAHQPDIDRGRRFARTTDVLLFGGGALLVGGVLWWVLGGSSDDDSAGSQTNVQAMCAETGCELGVRGSF